MLQWYGNDPATVNWRETVAWFPRLLFQRLSGESPVTVCPNPLWLTHWTVSPTFAGVVLGTNAGVDVTLTVFVDALALAVLRSSKAVAISPILRSMVSLPR